VSDTFYLGNLNARPLTVKLEGLPTPVFNSTVSTTRSNRVEALYAALAYHRDHQDDTVPDVEEICGTAGVFEYYLDKGEFPAG